MPITITGVEEHVVFESVQRAWTLDTSGAAARRLLEESPFSDTEKAAIGSGNWDRLTARR